MSAGKSQAQAARGPLGLPPVCRHVRAGPPPSQPTVPLPASLLGRIMWKNPPLTLHTPTSGSRVGVSIMGEGDCGDRTFCATWLWTQNGS